MFRIASRLHQLGAAGRVRLRGLPPVFVDSVNWNMRDGFDHHEADLALTSERQQLLR
jgi:hypothetical protein